MRTREYRTDMGARIIMGVVALIGLGLGGLALITGVIVSAQFSPDALAVGLFFTGFGVYAIAFVVRPDVLTVDETGLRLRRTFGTKHIPWETVRAFRVVAAGKGIQVRAVLHTGKNVGMGSVGQGFAGPGVRQIVAELTQVLHERTESAQPPRGQAGADAFPGQLAQVRGSSLPRSEGRRNGRRENPKAVFLVCLVLTLGIFGGLMLTAAVSHAVTGKSADTQTHGLPRSGIVTSVTNHETKSPYSDVGVRLGEPVNGQAATTAHVRPITSLKPGAAVRVLVDPEDPGYAEFPGQRYMPNFVFSVAVAGLLACLAFMAFATARWGRVWFRQRGQVAAS